MMKNNQLADASRRRFIKHSSLAAGGAVFVGMTPTIARASLRHSSTPLANSPIVSNPLGFNGERKDPVTGCYPLGNGYRMYNPRIMRFHAADSTSPFGKGGINSYAYCLGDPVNKSDPSGHFAILSLITGAIVGAIAGAAVSAAAEGIRAAVTGTKFDAKQVGIGAALGLISGGFGAAAVGAKTGVKVGLAVADSVVSGAADFGINVATGTPAKQAGINAGIGAVVGLATFGGGGGLRKLKSPLSSASQKLANTKKKTSRAGLMLGDTKPPRLVTEKNSPKSLEQIVLDHIGPERRIVIDQPSGQLARQDRGEFSFVSRNQSLYPPIKQSYLPLVSRKGITVKQLENDMAFFKGAPMVDNRVDLDFALTRAQEEYYVGRADLDNLDIIDLPPIRIPEGL